MLLSSGCCSIQSVSQLYIYTLIREAYVLLGERKALIVAMTRTARLLKARLALPPMLLFENEIAYSRR